MPDIISISVFGFTVFCAVGLYWLLTSKSNTANQRLNDLRKDLSADSPEIKESATERIVQRVAEPVSRLAPPSAAEAQKLQKKLMHAGFRSPNAPIIYRAIQLVCLVSTPSITIFVLLAMGRSLSSSIAIISISVGVGYLLPRSSLDHLTKSRQQRLRWGLADALDLLVISVEAGLGVNAAMVRVSNEMRRVHPEISEEFEMVNLEIRVGREREHALRNLAERTGVEDLRGLCAMLIQADRFGTSIARAIRNYSDSLRTKRRQRAEQAAQKAAIKLLFPLAIFLFPTLFIALIGPAMLQLMDNFFKK
ncbi:MAG: type II secretion system F family protein [Acidobacteria bacterium]|nr:type II secretion system F family protein [Acidobacteriota bacterium]